MFNVLKLYYDEKHIYLFITRYYRTLEDGSILNYGKRFSPLTISSYKQLLNSMKGYKYNFNIEELDLNSVNNRRDRLKVTRKLQSKVNGYLNLMLDDCKHNNTRKAHLKVLRSTLKKAESYYGYLFLNFSR